jgi:transmembrane sensor
MALHAQAVELVQLLVSANVTPADVAMAKTFRAKSPDHDAAFAAASRLWNQFGPAAGNLRDRGMAPVLSRTVSPMARRAFVGGGLAAASLAVAAMAKPPLQLWPSFAEFVSDYRTEVGELRLLALNDDISMRMNTRTSVRKREADAVVDRLEIISGQASFATSAASQRAIAVFAADGVATSKNGRFDVRCFEGEVRVTCIEGETSVRRGTDAATIRSAEQVVYSEDKWQQIGAVDVGLVTAWEQGVLIFRMTPLSEVVKEINRYRSGRVVVLNSDLARKTVSGRFHTDHIGDIFLRLDQALGIKSRMLPGGVVLLS